MGKGGLEEEGGGGDGSWVGWLRRRCGEGEEWGREECGAGWCSSNTLRYSML